VLRHLGSNSHYALVDLAHRANNRNKTIIAVLAILLTNGLQFSRHNASFQLQYTRQLARCRRIERSTRGMCERSDLIKFLVRCSSLSPPLHFERARACSLLNHLVHFIPSIWKSWTVSTRPLGRTSKPVNRSATGKRMASCRTPYESWCSTAQARTKSTSTRSAIECWLVCPTPGWCSRVVSPIGRQKSASEPAQA